MRAPEEKSASRFHRLFNAVEQFRKNRALEAHRVQQLALALDREARMRDKGEARIRDKDTKSATRPDPAPSPAADPALDTAPEPEDQFARALRILSQPVRIRPQLNQYIDVQIKEGLTITNVNPPKAALLAESQTMDPPPEIVYRNMCFHQGFPPEYHWVRRELPGRSNCRQQCLTWAEWLVDREAQAATGHLLPKNPDDHPAPEPVHLTP